MPRCTSDIFVVGQSRHSWGSPLAYSTGDNSFVARLASNGQLVWNTFLGGENSSGTSLAITENDEIYVVGYSFYSWGAPLQPHRGNYDIYVARFNEDGSQVWHTFAGGSNNDWPSNALLDKNGDIVISGDSYGRWGNPLRPYIQNRDAVVFKMNSDGNLLWSTFLGGPGEDFGFGIAMDSNGKIYICGSSKILWGEGKKITWMPAPLEVSGYGLPVWETGYQRLDRAATEENFIAASGTTNAHYFISDITYGEHATQVNLLQDPSFEAYTPNLYWEETSDNFYTLSITHKLGLIANNYRPGIGKILEPLPTAPDDSNARVTI